MIQSFCAWLLWQPLAAARFIRPKSFSTKAAVFKSSPLVHPLVPEASSKIILRDYQEECIQSVLMAIEEGHKRLGVSLATGGGKTVCIPHSMFMNWCLSWRANLDPRLSSLTLLTV